MGFAIAGAIIGMAGAAYAASETSKASKDAANNLNNYQRLDLSEIPPPEIVDWQSVLRDAIGTNISNLPMTFDLANQVNQFQTGQFLRGVSTLQPYYKQNQELIGRNAASFARGELPSDVVDSIGRAAAQRGFVNGIGMGASGGGPGTALGGLNLRNLGLTSLDLSKTGTQMAMAANQSAASMLPALFDPSSMFISPNTALGVQQFNVGTVNDWNKANVGIRNAEATGNTELANAILEAQTGLRYQGQLASAAAVQSASNTMGGMMGKMGGMGGGGGSMGGAGAGMMSGAGAGGGQRYLF